MGPGRAGPRSEEHTSELQSRENLVCRRLLEKKNRKGHRSSPPRAAPGRVWLAVCSSRHRRAGGVFFFNDTATTEIYTLSLHDALPIWSSGPPLEALRLRIRRDRRRDYLGAPVGRDA